MKVAFNIYPLQSNHQTRGIGFYTRHLLDELKTRDDIKIQEFINPDKINDAQVIHYPFFDLFQRTLPLAKKIPTVVTIHDVIPLVFPQHYPPGIKGSINYFFQRIALSNIAAVITDSFSSKKDLEKYLKIPAGKIYVVYLAADEKYQPIKNKNETTKIQNKYHLPNKYCIFIGSVNWNKNLLNLTEASLKAKMNVIFVGGDFKNQDNLDHPERQSYKEFLKRYRNCPGVYLLGYVEDEDLIKLLCGAMGLLLPSYYEGFGLPILTAQQCGVPTITSKVSSMPEVAGKGAILVNPENLTDLTQAILSLSNQKITDKIIMEGFKNIQRFNWQKTTEQTIEVYKKCLK